MSTATVDNIVEHRKFVCANADANNNKFWEYTLFDDDTVIIAYGRVGSTRNEEPRKHMSRAELDRKVAGKVNGRSGKEPYKELKVIAGATGPSGPATKIENVREAAVRDIAGTDKVLADLVDRLAVANKHELNVASGGKLDIDLTTGIISSALGVVSKDTIVEARKLLKNLQPLVKKADFEDTRFKHDLSEYLMLVPQKVDHRGWHRTFLPDTKAVGKQSELLDQLETSVDLATQRLEDARKAAATNGDAKPSKAFHVELTVIEESHPDFKRITKFFHEGKNDMHTSKRLRPIRVYGVHIPTMRSAFDIDGAKLDNNWELWHGTRTFNVLSIMKSGLIIPKSGGTYQVTGRMFGDGLYFSDQSTKSLNYSYGYWDGGSKDSNCFMFLAKVAMGKHYVPGGGYGLRTIPAGYDSCYAKAGHGGVRNNEMIVYRTSQADLRYLVEFSER